MPDQHSRRRLPLGAPAAGEHPLLTVRQTAAKLGFSAMTIRRRIDARQFPAVKIGSKAMVPRSFVDRLLKLVEDGHTVVVEEFASEWMHDASEAS
jgi:excisionase family DNA binding protein